MSASGSPPYAARCACGSIHFELIERPLIVHCCHCTWCQRETGSGFAINALIETSRLRVTKGKVSWVTRPSNSGIGQRIAVCGACSTVLWSHYRTAKERVAFVRAGTLAEADRIAPDIHIHTSSKLPWVQLHPNTPSVTEYYEIRDHWPIESLERLQQALQQAQNESWPDHLSGMETAHV